MAEKQGTGDGTGAIFSFDADNGNSADSGNVTGGNTPPLGSVDPAAARGDTGGSNNASPNPPKRGRGRPKGSGKSAGAGATKTATPLDLNFVQFSLMGIHTMLASVTKTPELELNDDEAERIAKSIQNVAQYYPVYVDAKTQAWMALIMTAGAIYGSRGIAIAARMKTEANAKRPSQSAQVFPFAPPNMPTNAG